MARNPTKICLPTVAAYLFYAVGPVLHLAGPARGALAPDRPQPTDRLEAAWHCPDPCPDPSHEHSPHDPDHCRVCQLHAGLHVAGAARACLHIKHDPEHYLPLATDEPLIGDSTVTHAIRGPPIGRSV
jgi:hypothetical protein